MTGTVDLRRLFIVGCPRSGSTWATHLLAQHPHVAAFQHAKFFEYLFHVRKWHHNKARFSYLLRRDPDADPTARDEKDPRKKNLESVLSEKQLFQLLRQFASEILEHVASFVPEAELVVDKTPENGRFGEFIHRMFPDAYFLHIVRDPRSTFCSMRSASRSWAQWEFPTRPVDGGRFWVEEVLASRQIGRRTDRYLELRYEDLREDGPGQLARVFEWAGLKHDLALCEEAIDACTKDRMRDHRTLPKDFVRKVPQGGWRDELSSREVRILDYLTRDLMAELGYAPAREVRGKPLGVLLQDLIEAPLAFLDRRGRRLLQLAHWGIRGRKLEWPEP